MQIKTLIFALFVSSAAAQLGGGTCFDDGDCILKGGKCIKTGSGLKGILGNCVKPTSTTLRPTVAPPATTTAHATQSVSASVTRPGASSGRAVKSSSSSAKAPAATGAVCFDDGDCLLTRGKCVRSGTGFGAITGRCQAR